MWKKASLPYYLLFTACFSLFWFLFKLGGIIDAGAALRSTAVDMVLNIAVLVLTVEVLLPRYFYPGRYARFTFLLVAVIFLGGSAIIVLQLRLMQLSLWQYQASLAKFKLHFFYWFWSDLVAGSYFMIAFIALTGAAIRLAFDRSRAARRLAELEAEHLRSELANIRDQLNPHFLFNALNTIYYRIDKANTAARSLTQQFSSLLRYQLYECNDPLVPIEKEIQFIEHYIELQKQRTGDQLEVSMQGFALMRGFAIPPHLLMPLVENCFKHVSHFAGRPNYIRFFCGREHGQFQFQTVNSFDPAVRPAPTGIGLTATRKRLNLLYNDRYILTTTDSDSCFETTLKIPLP